MKFSMLLVGIIICSIPSIAQNQDNDFHAGLSFGINGVELNGETQVFWHAYNGTIWGTGGISGGIFIERYLSNSFLASLQIKYTRKGSLYEFTDKSTLYQQPSYEGLRLNYIELPLSIGYKLNTSHIYFLFETGLAYAKLFSSKMSIEELSKRNTTPSIEEFKDTDITWNSHVKIPINQHRGNNLFLGLGVSHSIVSIHKVYRLYNFVYGFDMIYLFKL